MEEYSSFELPFQYSDQDHYIRAVRENMIRKNGDIKGCAFKSRNGGASVTRSNRELLEYAIGYMKAHFDGVMAVFEEKLCAKVRIYEKYSPSLGHNLHHWELYGDIEESALSDEQIDSIINACVLM